MKLASQSPAWHDRLATLQAGYTYPWRSTLGAMNGEDEYLALIQAHLTPQSDLLDAACGHGPVALHFAPHCRSVFAYDRVAAYIELAAQTAQAQGIDNVTFRCADSSAEANGGAPHIPAPDHAFDLLICRKGPFHWLEDARRVARPGAVLIMLVPDAVPYTPWHGLLPQELRWREADDPHWARPAIERRLAITGLSIHSWWSFEVPETFATPADLYTWLTFGTIPAEVPSFAQMEPVLDQIFATYAAPGGLSIARRQYLWQAVVPA